KIFFAMRQDRSGAVNDGPGVQATFADLVLPNRFAGLWLNSVSHAVAGALNQQARAVDIDADVRGVCRIVRPAAGRAHPDRLAGFLVEGHEAVRATCVLAPGER